MKKQLLLAGLLAMTGAANAQWSVNVAHVYKTNPNGNLGVGTGANPAFKVDVNTNTTFDDGVRVLQGGGAAAFLSLNNTSLGGQNWTINSLGSASPLGAGHFVVRANGNDRFFIHRSTGNVGIGTTSPGMIMDISSGGSNAGIRLTQSTGGDCFLTLNNNGGGSQLWTLNADPNSHFTIGNPGGIRMFISGASGQVGLGGNTNPAYALDVTTNAANGGLRLFQNSGGDCRLHLDNGGSDWTLNSTTTGALRAQYNLTDRFLVDGNSGYFGIGTTGPICRLHVESSGGISATSAGYFDYNTSIIGGGAGIAVQSFGTTNNQTMIGVDAGATTGAITGNTTIGIKGGASGADWNYGGFFKGLGSSGGQGGVGVYGELVPGTMGAFNAAVWGNWNGAAGANDWAGYFDGNVNINGTAWCSANVWGPSDRRFKQNINPLGNVTEKLLKLEAYTYTYKTEEFKRKNFAKEEQIGLIAQELKEVFPQLVKEDAEGYNHVNYIGLIPVLLEAFKEQQKQLLSQQAEIDELKQAKAATGIQSTGSAETGFSMGQNEPNPFSTETVIKYNLPQTVSNAYMAVYDLSGKQITTFPIERKGQSSMTITASQLAAGIYIYSIVADGKVMDSKKMIVADK